VIAFRLELAVMPAEHHVVEGEVAVGRPPHGHRPIQRAPADFLLLVVQHNVSHYAAPGCLLAATSSVDAMINATSNIREAKMMRRAGPKCNQTTNSIKGSVIWGVQANRTA